MRDEVAELHRKLAIAEAEVKRFNASWNLALKDQSDLIAELAEAKREIKLLHKQLMTKQARARFYRAESAAKVIG